MGTAIDSVAVRSCIGVKQAKALAKIQEADQRVMKSKISFKFRDIIHQCFAKMLVSIRTRNVSSTAFTREIDRSDFLILIGLDAMRP